MRLFIAINFPDDTRTRLWDALEPLRSLEYPVRWVRAELIHLTVKFLGEVDEARVPEIVDRLRQAVNDTRAFPLPVREFGVFPSVKRPRVLWVGCEGLPVLELLQDSVERQMAAAGFEIEGRPFRPHVTIGRAKRDAKRSDFKGLARELEQLEFFEEPQVTAVDLMCSFLKRGGPRYERLGSVDLAL